MIKWTAPWAWSKQTRHAKVGRLVSVYINPSMGGGYFATINGTQFRRNLKEGTAVFKTLAQAKREVEAEIVKRITRAYKQIQK